MPSEKHLRCSFCGKHEREVTKLVAGRRGYICDVCVAIAGEIIADSHGGSPPPGPGARRTARSGWIDRLRGFLRRLRRGGALAAERI